MTMYWQEEENDDSSLVTTTPPHSSSLNDIYQLEKETSFMWEAILRTPRLTSASHVFVRAFTGGDSAVQRDPFLLSFRRCSDAVFRKHKIYIYIDYMDTKTLAKKRWSPVELIDWLLESHIHFITAHAHQGLRSHAVAWNMKIYMQQLQRLQFHVGFPSNNQVSCPVFTQDKYQYLKHLGDMANNTFVAPITSDGEYDEEMLEHLKRYTDQHLILFCQFFLFACLCIMI